MRAALLALLLALQGLPPAGSLEVRARGPLVSIRAHQVPLSRILDRLAQQTGMKLTYESGAPSVMVSATLEEMPQTEALTRIFEGLGLNYVYRTDAGGQRVQALIVSDTSGTAAPPRAAHTQPPPMEFPPDMGEPQEVFEDAPPEFAQPEVPPMPAPPVDSSGAHPPGVMPPEYPGQPGAPSFPLPISNPFPQ